MSSIKYGRKDIWKDWSGRGKAIIDIVENFQKKKENRDSIIRFFKVERMQFIRENKNYYFLILKRQRGRFKMRLRKTDIEIFEIYTVEDKTFYRVRIPQEIFNKTHKKKLDELRNYKR